MKSLPHYIFTIGIFIGFIQGSLLAQTFEFAHPVRVIADGKVINTGSHIGHSGPAIADLNDDGKPDLLVGNFSGTIEYFENVGSAFNPVFAAGKMLEAQGKIISVNNW